MLSWCWDVSVMARLPKPPALNKMPRPWRKKRRRLFIWIHQMAVGVGWWFCIVSWYVMKPTVRDWFRAFCHDKIEGICTALKSVGSAGVFSGERVGNGYIKELWDLLRGTAGWVWRFVREHQLDWIHHVQPQALWRYGHHSNHLRSNMTGHKPSFVCDPLGPLASVACSKLGNRVTSIVGAFLVSAASSPAYLPLAWSTFTLAWGCCWWVLFYMKIKV